MANIQYQTEAIAKFFSTNRVRWNQFYESERRVIQALAPSEKYDVLDIGCGCGGLGFALREQFGVTRYTGVEINSLAVEIGNKMNPGALLHGDILDIGGTQLLGRQFDLVFSLSCVDWNVEFSAMLIAAWNLIQPGGSLVATFRLTDGLGCRDMAQSYQYINYTGAREGELAAYVVLNAGELMADLVAFDPSHMHLYGYWGAPSASAVTPYERLCFLACSMTKRKFHDDGAKVQIKLELPAEIRAAIDRAHSNVST